MNVILADDEPLARDRLRRLLNELPNCELLAEAHNGEQLLSLVDEFKPDVVLLDIHMPGMDGLQTARHIAELTTAPAVIFTTAHSEHALSAFDTTASAYLLKPIRRDELSNALQRAQQPSQAQLRSLQNSNSEAADVSVLLTSGRSQQRIHAHQIICCLADQKLTRVVHQQGEGWCDESLQELEARLGANFLRVHRGALIATHNIHSLIAGPQHRLKLKHQAIEVPVSRRRLPALRTLLRS